MLIAFTLARDNVCFLMMMHVDSAILYAFSAVIYSLTNVTCRNNSTHTARCSLQQQTSAPAEVGTKITVPQTHYVHTFND